MRVKTMVTLALAGTGALALTACEIAEPQRAAPSPETSAARPAAEPRETASIEQGLVEGRRFSHPLLHFTLTVPEGFAFTDSAEAVTAAGPNSARFTLDGDGGAAAEVRPLDLYIAEVWVPEIASRTPVGRLSGLRRGSINGLETASATLPVLVDGHAHDALLVAVHHDGRLYRMIGLAPRGAGMLDRFAKAARSFRPLAPG